MKRFAFLIIFTLFLFSSVAGAVPPTVSVVASNTTIKVGDNITVNISVDPGDNATYGAQFDLNYTFPALNAISIVKGPFLTPDGTSSLVVINKCDNSISQCSYSESRIGENTPGITTPGILATITFKADSAGVVPLNLNNVILSDPSASPIENVTLSNATITIQSISTPTQNLINSGSGGGGGGGGGTSGEDFKNIENQERKDDLVYAGKQASFEFKQGGPVDSVTFTGKKNLGDITVSVEVLRSTSTLVKAEPSGTVYRNFNLWVGTSGIGTPENIENPVIRFKVENAWLASNNFAPGDVALFRWDTTGWSKLETNQIGRDEMNTSFEAKTEHFSPFVISASKASSETITPSVTTGTSPKVTQTITQNTPAPIGKSGGFEILLVIAMVMISYVIVRKR